MILLIFLFYLNILFVSDCTIVVVPSTIEADNGQFCMDERTFQRIHDLLTVHRIEDAVSLAERAGLSRLALILSQLDGDCSISTLIRNQLEVWRNQGAIDTIPTSLLNVYRIAGGMVIVDEDEASAEGENLTASLSPRSTLLGLGWARALGSLFWFCANSSALYDDISSFSHALEMYKLFLQDELVDPPSSPFVTDDDPLGADVSLNKTQHGLFSLLQLLYFSSTDMGMVKDLTEEEMQLAFDEKAINALSPLGFSRDALDYRGPYLLLVLLECADLVSPDAPYALIIRQHFITQLLWSGHWQWATAVALQIRDVAQRASIVRDIVLRYGGLVDWEDQSHQQHLSHPHEILHKQAHHTLTRKLSVPEELIHESTAYRCRYSGQYEDEVKYLLNAGLASSAMQVLVSDIAPAVTLASAKSAQKIWTLMESAAGGMNRSPYNDYWANPWDVVLTFFRLKFQVQEKQNMDGVDVQHMDEELEEIRTDAHLLIDRIQAYINERDSLQREQDAKFGKSLTMYSTVLSNMFLQDMYSYLYNLLVKLEAMRGSFYSVSSLGGAAEQFLHQLGKERPLRNEVLLQCVATCTTSFKQDAARRFVEQHTSIETTAHDLIVE